MTETAWTGFRITLAYTERDLAIYRRLTRDQRQARWGGALLFGLFVTGFLAASCAAIFADAADALRYKGGPTVATLCFLVFWLGCWAPVIWSSLLNRRATRQRMANWLARWNGAVMSVSPAGIAIRMKDVRTAVGWPAVTAATAARGFVLLATATGGTIAIPARLLEPAQRTRLLARGA